MPASASTVVSTSSSVIQRQDSTLEKNKDEHDKRKRKPKTQKIDDKSLLKKLKMGDEVKRNVRQECELETFDVMVSTLASSEAIDERTIKCGVCGVKCLCDEHRSAAGKVKVFRKKHFDQCKKNKEKNEEMQHSCSKITKFFKKKSSAEGKPRSPPKSDETNADDPYDDHMILLYPPRMMHTMPLCLPVTMIFQSKEYRICFILNSKTVFLIYDNEEHYI